MNLRRTYAALLILSALVTPAGAARADIILAVESVTAQAGSTGNGLDVLLTNTGTDGVAIDAFAFGLSIESGITLTGANTSTLAVPYLFQGHSFFGPDLATATGLTLLASDLHDEPGVGVILAPGATLGLGRVSFDVDPSASGVYLVILLPFPTTGLSFDQQDIAIQQFRDGRIAVASQAVPEPSALALAAIGVACSLALAKGTPGSRSDLGQEPHPHQ